MADLTARMIEHELLVLMTQLPERLRAQGDFSMRMRIPIQPGDLLRPLGDLSRMILKPALSRAILEPKCISKGAVSGSQATVLLNAKNDELLVIMAHAR